ncbi:hypothetical protein Ciccas_003304 [Cichlidogyrus casuarinus]|uniref:Uncharacterized protein n=1 Tax=Cichlidogyrus casuarinus TaxID=1844966 RepID=A0ABD2QFP4_9PLAT
MDLIDCETKQNNGEFLAPYPGKAVNSLKTPIKSLITGHNSGVFSDDDKDNYSLFANGNVSPRGTNNSSQDDSSCSDLETDQLEDPFKIDYFKHKPEPELVTVLNLSNEAVPPQLWQDYNGRPANVHEFTDFLSLQGLSSQPLEDRLNWYATCPHKRAIIIHRNNSSVTNKHICTLGSTPGLFKSTSEKVLSMKPTPVPTDGATTPGERLVGLVASVQNQHPTATFTINEHGHGSLKVASLSVAKKRAAYVYPGQKWPKKPRNTDTIILDEDVSIVARGKHVNFRPTTILSADMHSLTPSTVRN